MTARPTTIAALNARDTLPDELVYLDQSMRRHLARIDELAQEDRS